MKFGWSEENWPTAEPVLHRVSFQTIGRWNKRQGRNKGNTAARPDWCFIALENAVLVDGNYVSWIGNIIQRVISLYHVLIVWKEALTNANISSLILTTTYAFTKKWKKLLWNHRKCREGNLTLDPLKMHHRKNKRHLKKQFP